MGDNETKVRLETRMEVLAKIRNLIKSSEFDCNPALAKSVESLGEAYCALLNNAGDGSDA